MPPPNVCTEAFTPNWEDFGLANFFVPALEHIYTGLGERDGQPTLLLEHGTRKLELSGHVRCIDLRKSNELMQGMQSFALYARVSSSICRLTRSSGSSTR